MFRLLNRIVRIVKLSLRSIFAKSVIYLMTIIKRNKFIIAMDVASVNAEELKIHFIVKLANAAIISI